MKYSAVIGLLSICVFRSSLATPTFGLVANLLNKPKHFAFPAGFGLHGHSGIGSGASDYIGSDKLDDDTKVNMHPSGGLGSLFGNTPGKTYGGLDLTTEDTANHPSYHKGKEDISKYIPLPLGPVLPTGSSGRPGSLFGNHKGEDSHAGLYGNHEDVSGSFGGVSGGELPSESDVGLHIGFNSGESSIYKAQALKIKTLGRQLARCGRIKAALEKLLNAKFPHLRNIGQFESDDLDY